MIDQGNNQPEIAAGDNQNKVDGPGKGTDPLGETLNLDDIGIAFDDKVEDGNKDKKVEQVTS